MKKFRIPFKSKVWVTAEVEAETKEEAMKIAQSTRN